ncbi:MAG TPA: hypothetical protein VHX13_07975 [Acidobacteriaceae bacterium]|nr:hypothetical protein [Acidobacteriaceae bacterium]
MSKGLQRLFEVRQLLEELAGLDLQARAAELRRLEGAAQEHGRLAAEARSQAMGRLLAAAVTDSWLEMADAEIYLWKRARIEAAARKVSEDLAVLRERRMTRRMERQQAEALLAEAARAEEEERRRREQQGADDWFQGLPPSEPRHSG